MEEGAAVTVAVPFEGQAAPKTVRLSLQGVSAALDFMETNARRVAQY